MMYRANSKWAKVTGKRGDWCVAKGFDGDTEALRTSRFTIKRLAQLTAEDWVNDK